MVKGRFFAVGLAVILHALLLLMISQTFVIPSAKTTIKTTPKPIKSFLYIPPKKELSTAPKPETEAKPQPQKLAKKVIQKTAQQNQATTKNLEVKNRHKNDKEIVNQASLTVKEQQPPVTAERSAQSTTAPSFSSLRQLEQLRQQLNNTLVEQEVAQFTRRKSVSVLDDQPESVRHSTTLSQEKHEQQRQQNTLNISGDIKIIKGDDGSCYIEKDLSNVGMEGLSSVESFSCGQSKFDKSFIAHMKKVLKKLGK